MGLARRSGHYRWAVLRVLVEAYPSADRHELAGPVLVQGNAVHVVAGDVQVDRDLVLEEGAVLFVLGGLSVSGALVCRPVLLRGRREGDRVCRWCHRRRGLGAGRHPVSGHLLFGHNDYSARAASYDGDVLVDFERYNAFGRLAVRERVTDWDFQPRPASWGSPTTGTAICWTRTQKSC